MKKYTASDPTSASTLRNKNKDRQKQERPEWKTQVKDCQQLCEATPTAVLPTVMVLDAA